MNTKELYLIDGTGLIYKAFYGIRELSTTSGEPVNAIYGLARMLIKLLKDRIHPHDYCCFTIDTARKTFRQEMFDEYKATRQQTPEDLIKQIPAAYEIANALGLYVLGAEGFEADDLIATLVQKFGSQFGKVWIITSDKDLMQLVTDHVHLLRAETGVSELKRYDPERIQEKYGIDASQFVDYLALIGDSSDNIPGVNGIGPKTAVKLLQTFSSIEQIFSRINEVTHSYKNKLEGKQDIAYLSKKLVQLDNCVPIDIQLEQLEYQGLGENLIPLLEKWEFQSMIEELQQNPGQERMFSPNQIHIAHNTGSDLNHKKRSVPIEPEIVTSKTSAEIMDRIQSVSEFGFDIETDSLDPLTAQLIGFSLCLPDRQVLYFPMKHKEGENLPRSILQQILHFAIEHRTLLVGHNLKFDLSVVNQLGFPVPTNIFDTMVSSYLLDPDRRGFGLKVLAKDRLGIEMDSFEDTLRKKAGHNPYTDFSEVPIKEAAQYACTDALATYELYRTTNEALEREQLVSLFHEVEMPLIPVLMNMEKNGVFFDLPYLARLSKEFGTEIERLQDQIYELCGEPFNLNSPRQIGKILFEKMQLPAKGKTSKSKVYSTSAAVLEELAGDYEVARLLLEYRKVAKLKSTYVDSIPLLVHPQTKRVHTSFHQTGTATGRLSSSDPNLQNLPVKDEKGRKIRQAVIPQKKGWKLIGADYSQIELRLMAHIANDHQLIRAFQEDKDIHTFTSSAIFGVEEKEVTNDMRRIGKMVNFSIIYGVSSYGLSSRLGLSNSEGSQIIEGYFKTYPQVKSYMSRMVECAKKTKEVRTLFGRKRKISWIDAHNGRLRMEAERIAINAPIQGTAADIMKLAMIRVYQRIQSERKQAYIILQIHDELVIEAPEDEAISIANILKDEMEQIAPLRVPLKVDVSISDHFE